MEKTHSTYQWTRFFFQRALGLIYLVAFTATIRQFQGLIGEHGLTPARLFIGHVSFWETPSLFFFNSSDAFIATVSWAGWILSLLAVTGLSERFGAYRSAAVWGLLWLFYLSIVNVGQIFYSFGWETMTLETGFLAIFFGSRDTEPPARLVWFLRWELFRLMLGAGLIKMRGDACWRDLTCMFYHYETQPIPNPLSWYFHHLPHGFLKFQTLYTHFVELIVPWFYFVPGPCGWIAGILTIGFQGCLILSGNLSWLNYLTLAVAIGCFDDQFFSKFLKNKLPAVRPAGPARKLILSALGVLIVFLSVDPAVNLFSPRQMMNTSFEPLHLVNTYGAFGSVTKERREIVFEGTEDWQITDQTRWREYEFKAKPGDIHRRPPIVAPYHLRLDWLLWFAAMTDWREHPWVLNLVNKLLQNDPGALSLIEKNPFSDHPPHYIRAVLYRYRFTTAEEKRNTGDWWVRTPVGLYLPPISLENPVLRKVIHAMGWEYSQD